MTNRLLNVSAKTKLAVLPLQTKDGTVIYVDMTIEKLITRKVGKEVKYYKEVGFRVEESEVSMSSYIKYKWIRYKSQT